MIFTKCRRETGSFHSLAPSGNSRSTHCRNSGVSANSSRLRQYVRPDCLPGSISRASVLDCASPLALWLSEAGPRTKALPIDRERTPKPSGAPLGLLVVVGGIVSIFIYDTPSRFG